MSIEVKGKIITFMYPDLNNEEKREIRKYLKNHNFKLINTRKDYINIEYDGNLKRYKKAYHFIHRFVLQRRENV